MALKLGLNLGYWGIGPAGEEAVEVVKAAESAGYESVWAAESYGSDVVSVLAWLAPQTTTINLGAAILQVPARPPAAAAMAGATIDKLSGGRFMFGFGPSGPQVSEGWYGVPYAKPWGRTREYIEVVREIIAREGPVDHQGEHYQLPLPGGEGKALKLNFHPLRNEIPVFVGAIGRKSVEMAAEICDGWIPIFFSVDAFESTWGEHLEAGFAKGGRQRSDLEVSPSLRSRSTATSRRRRASSRPASSSTSAGWEAARPTSTSTSRTASASATSPTRSSAATRTATEAAPTRRCRTRSSRRPRWSAPRRRSPSGSSASAAPAIDRLIVSPVHVERDQQLHTLERLAAIAGVQAAA